MTRGILMAGTLALAVLVLLGAAPPAQSEPGPRVGVPPERLALLAKGVNLSHWMWLPSESAKRTGPHFVPRVELDALRQAGITHVRLPIAQSAFLTVNGEHASPGPNLPGDLRLVVALCLAADLAVVIDAHESDAPWIVKNAEGIPDFRHLEAFWQLMVPELSKYDPDRVFIEIMNEPHDLPDPVSWNAAQARIAAIVRKACPHHTIIATGDSWGGIDGLKRCKPLDDPNVVYSFHFYDSHTFTHQGATWGWEPWRRITGVPYPADAGPVQAAAAKIEEGQARWAVEQYGREGWNAEKVKARIAEAAAWSQQHGGLPLYCGEFGVYKKEAAPADRRAWLRDVRTALEEAGIGWSMWDYCGGFALAEGEPGDRVIDAEVAQVLGLRVDDRPGDRR